jgi:hypothetical protein
MSHPGERFRNRHPGQAKREAGIVPDTVEVFAIPCLRSVISCRSAHGTTQSCRLVLGALI